MPYEIYYWPHIEPKRKRPWKIYNLEKRKIVGSCKSRKMAERAIRARYAHEK